MDINNEQQKPRRGRPPKPRPLNPPPPRPKGRPKMAPEDKKNIHVPTRLTAEEHELWSRLAKADGRTLNGFITNAVREMIKRRKLS